MNRIVLVLTLAGACTSPLKKGGQNLMELEYASTFEIRQSSSGLQLVNTEPWPKAKQEKTFTFEKPLKRVVCTSTSHLPYFEMLGAAEAVVGFPNASFVSSKIFIERLANGNMVDLGNSQNLNMELLISLDVDAVIAFDAGGESNALNKIEKLGIPVIYNSDFLEQTPLGRAEYIKFFGALLGKQHKANAIFNSISKRYDSLRTLTRKVKQKPTLFSGTAYGDTWFLPGGENWAAQFYEHAGGDYLWSENTSSGWLELSFEAVFEQAHDADYWIGTSSYESLDALLGQDNRYSNYEAFQNQKVFNYDKKKGPGGGIDFFESGYSRPDLILSDLIKILHPQLLSDYETTYFQRLK